ncbi:hypothetical protein K4L44_16360 [Halosquirtibacter laminarini]|uniref:Uncharacterized protein n=1 Tax=Halosquirtibacter laminarini TaxID=3374600 RepID=A0AC61NER7_9BACT|nr:hypothetical protein K4L44_16360 [Prolixibacteraceae bacterium]
MKKIESFLLYVFGLTLILRITLIFPYRFYSLTVCLALIIFYLVWTIGSLNEVDLLTYFRDFRKRKLRWDRVSQGVGCILILLGLSSMEYIWPYYRILLWLGVFFIMQSFLIELISFYKQNVPVGSTLKRSFFWLIIAFMFISTSESTIFIRMYRDHPRLVQYYKTYVENPKSERDRKLLKKEFNRVEDEMSKR